MPRLSGHALEQFRAVIDETFWRTIPAVDGAVEACEQLVRAGYELICVTDLETRHLEARRHNLRELGFPLSHVYAIDSVPTASATSPKAAMLNDLQSMCFVDDYAPYLIGVDGRIHKVLITRDPDGSPNTGKMLEWADACCPDLWAFVTHQLADGRKDLT